jgi:hypothetical protein
MDDFSGRQLMFMRKGGNARFNEFLFLKNKTLELGEKLSSVQRYLHPHVSYYRELLEASVEEREPISFIEADWVTAAETHSNKMLAAQEKQLYGKEPSKWVPDYETHSCMLCETKFTIFKRKHHCRKCGRCVCADCAPKLNTRPILEWGIQNPVRHCKECYRSPVANFKSE